MSASGALIGSDPAIQVAFSVFENKGVFALLLGSGLSRSAGIPTGWEITLDLIRRIATLKGAKESEDLAKWYYEQTGREPNYSTLLEELAASPEERRSILHSYIEPTAEDRGQGRKLPTAAHYAVADLVSSGFIRVIITTNFDRLLENALRERGIEPTVVASADALAGAEPITHTKCYILKVHGDYKDARILNTDAELTTYPKRYNVLLDLIFDEYGLIVSGWSGEWDVALRDALMRTPNRRYPVYWTTRGTPSSASKGVVQHRKARVITISDANNFFSTLLQHVQTLAETQRQNPLSIDLLVNSAKRLLKRNEDRIELHELLAGELDRLLARLDDSEFAAQRAWNQQEFRSRVKKYEAATESLARMVGVLGRWGDGNEIAIVTDIIKALWGQSERQSAGLTVYLNVRSYPAVLIFTAYALGLARAERWKSLHRFFVAKLDRQYAASVRFVDSLFLWAWKGTEQDAWKQIEGRERLKTPLSDHLLELFNSWSKSFAPITPDFDFLFDLYEVLGSFAHLERNEKQSLLAGLSGGAGREFVWMPMGRGGWHERNATKIISSVGSEPMKAGLLAAGFGKSDPEFLDACILNFQRMADRMRW